MNPHFWQGQWIDDAELERRIARLPAWVEETLRPETDALDTALLLDTAERYSNALAAGAANAEALLACLRETQIGDEAEIREILKEMAAFLSRSNLSAKLRRELGSTSPSLETRVDFQDSVFESWAPLGFLVHVVPSNAPSVAPLSAVEGLLAGNLNFVKTSGGESLFPQLFLEGLLSCDPSGTLARYVVCARISSSRKPLLESLFSASDGISVWGGEEAVQSVKKLAPAGAKIIEWGHRISLAYLTREQASSESTLEALARECCFAEQQGCSSPQCAYLDTTDWGELRAFGENLARVLERVSAGTPRVLAPGPGERAEIALVTELAKQEACYGTGRVIESSDRSWRVLLDMRPALTASPLYRTIWVRPLPRARIGEVLRPMRRYLQTVGLACGLQDAAELSAWFLRSGAVRIRRIGEMPGSYSGEAHDGVYALAQYSRRVSAQLGSEARGISSFADLRANRPPSWPASGPPPVMRKAQFQEMKVDREHSQLFFKSGGSTGEPKLSLFTYEDYDEQMRIGAEGLYAAGLDPILDRSMNLFFSGALYGGFLSIFSVLERLRAPQLPMAAHLDFDVVADTIIRNEVNVLLGMPSYLLQLFEKQGTALARARVVKKIFYGGEHFNDAQRARLRDGFGVELIRSLGYGSVDTGPLGYQCRYCEGSVHHLHQRLQYLEILDLERDQPATPGAAGRLVFSSRARQGQSLLRYELGDLGQWVDGPCPCGRATPRFRLLGRSGDVFRIGSAFLNYQKLAQILSERHGYAGTLQLRLLPRGGRGATETVLALLSDESAKQAGLTAEQARVALLEGYDDLREVVSDENLLALQVEIVPATRFAQASGSGKTVRVKDER